jgi:hypothetical protein
MMAQAPATGATPQAQSPAKPPSSAPAQTPTQTQGGPARGPATTSAPAPVDPAKAAAVHQLMEVTGSGKLGEELIQLLTNQVRQTMSTVITQSDRMQQFMDAFTKNFETHITATQIDNAVVPIYAEHLSLDDINALVAFYKTPAGQHVIQALPLIIQESQNAGANMARPAAIETLRSMASQYPEINQVMPQQGAANPQAAPAPGQAPGQQQNSPSLRQIPTPH